MREIVQKIYEYYKDEKITKVLTIEVSGIAPAIIVATQFDIPMLFAKKTRAATLQKDQVYETRVYSYTKGTTSNVVVSKQYLQEDDRVLIIDDFLANGEAALGLVDLVDQAGAQVVGLGICIEESFQKGRKRLDDADVEVYSMVRVAEINSDRQEIIFAQGH